MASDCSSNQDMLNKLHDPLLLKVFSYLTFKQSAIASTISKRCLHLWRRQCLNVQFIETDFVTSSDPQNRDSHRNNFIDFAKNYIAHYDDKTTLHNFSLVFSKPEDYVHEINQFVHFALSHNVKNLTLDFSDPMWSDDDLEKHLAISYTLPDKFYQLYSVESLNLVLPTGEEPIRMQSTMNVRHLILKSELHEREYCGFKFLLASCPDLEKLTIQITPFRNLQDYEAPYYIDPVTFWTENVVVDKCVKRTLKTVEIIGYKGTWNEVRFLNYVLRFGTALSQVDLYPSRQVDDGNRGNLELYVQRAQNVRHLVMKNRKNLNVSVY
ncbi:hypothetical protein ACFE04_007640 [Oxalis oulophora]